MFVVPQFKVVFEDKAWVVNGDEELDTLCKILRWNGITEYQVWSHHEWEVQSQESSRHDA